MDPIPSTQVDFLKVTEMSLADQELIQIISILDLVLEDLQGLGLQRFPKEAEMVSMVLVMAIQEVNSPIVDVAGH